MVRSNFKNEVLGRLASMLSVPLVCLLSISGVQLIVPRAFADSICNVDSVNTHSASVGNDTGFTFSVSNTTDPISWVSIDVPSANVSIYEADSSDFQAHVSSDRVSFDGGSVSSGTEATINVSAHILSGGPQANWTVKVSTDPGGTNPVVCGGDTSLQFVDNSPPTISNIGADVTYNTAAVTWQTDQSANSVVRYGLDTNYGQEQDDNSYTTQHSIQLNGLLANTGYHYQVISYDQSGRGVASADNTFLTSDSPPASPSSGSTGLSNNRTGGQNASSDLLTLKSPKARHIEKIPPTIGLTTHINLEYKEPPTIAGTAADDTAVSAVEYSTDGGKNWLPADNTAGLNSAHVSFSFTPHNLADGTYVVIARAVDSSGNSAATHAVAIVIDRVPPVVGGMVVNVGTRLLSLDKNGTVDFPVGIDARITLSAAGGPMAIAINAVKSGKTITGTNTFQLTHSEDTGLWSGIMSFTAAGTYNLSAVATNGAGIKTNRSLSTIRVSQAGQVLDARSGQSVSAEMTVYSLNPETNTWSAWGGESFGQHNPSMINKKYGYNLLLPAGTYYIRVFAKGFQTFISNSFTVTGDTILTNTIRLHRKLTIFGVSLPWFTVAANNFAASEPLSKSGVTSENIDKPLPNFSLPLSNGQTLTTIQLLGKPTILTVLSTWSPSGQGQLGTLNRVSQAALNIIPVNAGQNAAQLSVYNRIAGYTLPVVADSDLKLAAPLGYANLPTHYFIDRHGIVKKVMVGVLSRKDLLANVQY